MNTFSLLPLRRAAMLLWIVTAVCSSPALAQERFELGEEGFEKVAEPEPGTPEGNLQEVRRLIAAGEGKKAEKWAKAWIKEHPNHPLLADAYLLRGDAKALRSRYYEALFDYEFVIRAYPGSEHFHTALERELAVADAFGRGVKRHFLGLRMLPTAGEAEELYIRIQERAPGAKVAERAGIELADFYYRRSEMLLAAEAYELFLKNYPDSQWRERAMQRHILANLATFKGPRFDATGLIEAQQRLRDYQRDFPAAAERLGAESLLTRIDETLATRAYLIADWYQRRDKPVSAVVMYKQVLKEHGGSLAARRAAERLAKLEPELFAGVAAPAPGVGEQSQEGDRPAVLRPDDAVAPSPDVSQTDIPDPAKPTDAPPPPVKREK